MTNPVPEKEKRMYLMSAKSVAKVLDCTRPHVENLGKEGVLTRYPIGRRAIRYRADEVYALLGEEPPALLVEAEAQ